jgi:hypothetical protein
MKNRRFPWTGLLMAAVFFTIIVLIGGCAGEENAPGAADDPAELPPAAVVKARETLAGELNTDIAEVAIDSYERAEWTDSCLGLGGPAESCLAAPHPGWLVMLAADGRLYEVRTDELGDIIRINQ